MNILKIEPFSGVSGDMFLGALAELSGAWDELALLPQKLGLKNVEISITDVEKAGIACKHIKILDHNFYSVQDENKASDGDHQDSHSHDTHLHVHHHHSHAHSGSDHNHSESDKNSKHFHHHHRHLKDIYKIIEEGDISPGAKNIAKEIFRLLGNAEAKVHGVDVSNIHFHEVGAIDSILDIVGSAYLLDKLDIQKTYSYDVCTGFGFVVTEHGKLPVPCPATKELLLGFPTYTGSIQAEMTTPSGAAILRYLNPEFEIPTLIEQKTGHGPGEKDFAHPNVLRLSLSKLKSERRENIFIIETNIDDMPYEIIGTEFQNQLFQIGALDFYYTQVIMKKGRPGLIISVITEQDNISKIADYLLENTTTIGLRYFPVSRKVLNRENKIMKTSLGDVRVKEIITPSGKKRITPEYESCAAIAREKDMPLTVVFYKVNSELAKLEENTF